MAVGRLPDRRDGEQGVWCYEGCGQEVGGRGGEEDYMTNEQTAVLEWMRKAGQECPKRPVIPSLEVRKLRARLIVEEAFETIEFGLGLRISAEVEDCGANYLGVIQDVSFDEPGGREPDLIELADGLADLQVVNLGTAVACGIDLEPVFVEVMRSNESKWWTGAEINYLKYPLYDFRPLGENEYCATDHGGKVQKSPSWSPPKIGPILETQGCE